MSGVKSLLRRGCCPQQGTAPCFVIEFGTKDLTLSLQATGITRRFPGVLAKDHATLLSIEIEL